MMMGFDRGTSGPCMVRPGSSSGDAAIDGPLGDDVRDRCIAGVDLDAWFARAAARSGSCIKVVRRDRREVRFGLESTRWNNGCFSLSLDPPLSDAESSQSEESSSSSIALSEMSSSSSDSKTASSS